MSIISRNHLVCYIFLVFAFAACDDDDPLTPPPDDPIASVVISPKEADFDAIGQSQQFTAKAYNDTGGEVSTPFSWSSSNVNVASVSSSGMVETTGEGTAFIKVTAQDKTDSALVNVELQVPPGIWWISKTGGNWSEASNWNTGSVPDDDDTVAITLEGNYTITLTSDISVEYITFGSDNGNQLISTGTNTLTIENGIMYEGGNLQIDGKVLVNGQLEWLDGGINGAGVLEVNNLGSIIADGNEMDKQFNLGTSFINNGLFRIKDKARILVDGKTFDNEPGAEVDFQGDDVSLSAIRGGEINNKGSFVKSQGEGFAFITPSSPDKFVSTGTLRVEKGILNIRDGELIGQIDIEEGAVLSQSGNTLVSGLHGNSGDGIFEIEGNINLAKEAGSLVRLNNVVLNSVIDGISGPGDLEIVGSLTWFGGAIKGEGKVTLNNGTSAKLRGGKSKSISQRTLIILGSLETDTQINLTMQEGAEILVDQIATWTHTGGGEISKGVGDNPTITINGSFIKNDPGAFEVAADFECRKDMFLNEGALTVTGAFNLLPTGTIIGGNTDRDNEIFSRKLIIINATSATLAGTIDVDSDGELAYLYILGSATIESTFKVLIDINPSDPTPAERLTFETGGVALNGTLEVNVLGTAPPPAGAQYQVVSTIDGPGNFHTINGAEVFNSIQEDERGVLLIR